MNGIYSLPVGTINAFVSVLSINQVVIEYCISSQSHISFAKYCTLIVYEDPYIACIDLPVPRMY